LDFFVFFVGRVFFCVDPFLVIRAFLVFSELFPEFFFFFGGFFLLAEFLCFVL